MRASYLPLLAVLGCTGADSGDTTSDSSADDTDGLDTEDTDSDSDTDTEDTEDTEDTDTEDTDTDTDTDSGDPFVGGGSYAQDFEDPTLFVDGAIGSQTFTDGARFEDAVGGDRIGFGSAHAGAQALNFYNVWGTKPDDVRLHWPVPATGTETVHVSFWAYNPFPTPVDVQLRRDALPPVTVQVQAQDWVQINQDLTAAENTNEVQLLVGAVSAPSSFSFRIDDVVIQAD